MTGPTFEGLSKFGVEDGPLEAPDENTPELAFIEDVLEHIGMEVPENPSDEYMADAEAFLAHYGILGMKWGRRRARGANGLIDKSDEGEVDPTKQAGAPRKNSSASTAARPSAKTMTNEELQSVIKRLQLEQQYAQLTAKKKPVLLAETQKIVANALRQNAQAYATQYTGVAVGALLKKAGVPNASEIAARAKKSAEDAAKDADD